MKVLYRVGFTACSVVLLLFMSGCAWSGEGNRSAKESERRVETYRNRRQTFAIHWFQMVAGENHGKNLVVSPFGTSLMLDSLLLGSDGKTKAEIERAASVANFEKEAFDCAAADNQVLAERKELKIAAGVFLKKDYQIESLYLGTLLKLTNQSIQNYDFAKPKAEKGINDWVAARSNGKITKLLDSVLPETRLLLLNVLVFNGQWKYAFDPARTQKGYFTSLTGKEIRIPMMQQEQKFRYLKEKNFQMLEMPYQEDRFSMFVFLPETGDSYLDFLKDFSADRFTQWRKLCKENTVDVRFPKFVFDNTLNLMSSLKTLGIQEAFTDSANFSRMTGNQELMVSQIAQGVYIKVDEKGTEAAAATDAAMLPKSAPVKKNPAFYADRPFLYLIVEKATDSILFMGQIVDPEGIAKKTELSESQKPGASIDSPSTAGTRGTRIDKKISTSINTSGQGGTIE